jgi:succinate dehydrogenase / fumarate reductase flavoprotein subunit
MGRIVGKSAANHVEGKRELTQQETETGTKRVANSGQDGLPESLRSLRTRLRDLSWNHAGIVRDEEGMEEGCRQLNELEQDLKKISWSNVRERTTKEDLSSAAFSLKAILSASLRRKESRGSFVRKDFPTEDNANWRKNSCLTYHPEENSFSVTYHDAK